MKEKDKTNGKEGRGNIGVATVLGALDVRCEFCGLAAEAQIGLQSSILRRISSAWNSILAFRVIHDLHR